MVAIKRKRRLTTAQVALTSFICIYLAQFHCWKIGTDVFTCQSSAHLLYATAPHEGVGSLQTKCGPSHRLEIQQPRETAIWQFPIAEPRAYKNHPQKSPRSHDLGLFHFISGAPGGIRTHDPCLRRAVLYPAELRMLVRATSYPCRPWASMPVFGRLSVGNCRVQALGRVPPICAVKPSAITQIRKV